MLKVSEIFGPSIQGEGVLVGTPSIFLRLAGCSLRCQWCDTKYAFGEGKPMPNEDIVDEIFSRCPRGISIVDIVITGGEPLEQSEELHEFLAYLFSVRRFSVTVETNGYHPPIEKFRSKLFWSVSPKLPSSGAYRPIAELPFFRYRGMGNSQWKFVVADFQDLRILREFFDFGWRLPNVVIQPCSAEGSLSYSELIAAVRDVLWRAGYSARVIPQAHVIAWGQQRGV